MEQGTGRKPERCTWARPAGHKGVFRLERKDRGDQAGRDSKGALYMQNAERSSAGAEASGGVRAQEGMGPGGGGRKECWETESVGLGDPLHV